MLNQWKLSKYEKQSKFRMIFRSLPERLSEAEIDEMLAAADTDGDDYWHHHLMVRYDKYLPGQEVGHLSMKSSEWCWEPQTIDHCSDHQEYHDIFSVGDDDGYCFWSNTSEKAEKVFFTFIKTFLITNCFSSPLLYTRGEDPIKKVVKTCWAGIGTSCKWTLYEIYWIQKHLHNVMQWNTGYTIRRILKILNSEFLRFVRSISNRRSRRFNSPWGCQFKWLQQQMKIPKKKTGNLKLLPYCKNSRWKYRRKKY